MVSRQPLQRQTQQQLNELLNEFHKDNRFLDVIDHQYNSRRRTQGRYEVKQFFE